MAQFNKREPEYSLPTRIGISGGPMFVGNVGTGDHYTYTPLGDIVNTASRIENLNKQLGTRLLVSHLVVENLTGFLIRKVGNFQLVGKRRPVVIYELLCHESEADAVCQEAIRFFLSGFERFVPDVGNWQKTRLTCVINFEGKMVPVIFMWDDVVNIGFSRPLLIGMGRSS